ncbi:MAG: transposase [Candidatus Levybacteria bacterium]|nr:transposase [Candidatus Levybacteria bacterium]
MPSRIIPFVNNEYYHLYNRGVAKMPIFNNFYDYNRFLKTMIYYSIEGPKPKFSIFTPTTKLLDTNKKIVDFICYCLMPNHFHFLLRQVKENGITEFLSKLSNSYTKYFNVKYKRVGPLFQGEFKAVHVESNEQLIHVNRYVHINPSVGFIIKNLEDYKWSSYPEYLNLSKTNICSKDIISGQFKTNNDYKQFILNQEDYGKNLEFIKHKLLDLEDEY